MMTAVNAWLCRSEADAVIAVARSALATVDPLAAGAHLRREFADHSAEQLSAALSQAELQLRAEKQYGIDAHRLRLTRDGLEQATDPLVAAHRARLLAGAGVRRVVDLTAGLGFDTAAFLAAGIAVTAVERDRTTAAFCAFNNPPAQVVVADATDAIVGELVAALAPTDAVFVDPARRDPDGPRDASSGRARPERDPERWSPPWSFVAAIQHPHIVAKVAPAFEPPPEWFAQWTSSHHTVVEVMVTSWPLIAQRCALVLPASDVVASSGELPSVDETRSIEVGDWLYEPDPAVVRAGAIGALVAEFPDLRLVSGASSWLSSSSGIEAPRLAALTRGYRVDALLSGSTAQQRRQLDDLGITTLTIKNRGTGERPADVLRRLRTHEGPDAVLVMIPSRGRTITAVTQPAPRRSAP